MDSALCLAQLRSLLESSPDFSTYTATAQEHQEWLARAHALIKKLNNSDALTIRLAPGMLTSTLFRDSEVTKIFGIIHRAIAELELEPQKTEQQAFASGAVYDFFNALKTALASASSAIFVIDPYLDDQIFDTYLANTPAGVSVRLLSHKYGNLLKPAVEKFNTQHGAKAEVRISTEFHDRVLFLDGLSCLVMGQSIKDAAKTKPTYLAPLPSDIAKLKLVHYEGIWRSANAL